MAVHEDHIPAILAHARANPDATINIPGDFLLKMIDACREDQSRDLGTTMDLEAAVARIQASVYHSTSLITRLTDAHKLGGEWHTARQRIAAFAANEVRMRWKHDG
jgi:hypothetical protein